MESRTLGLQMDVEKLKRNLMQKDEKNSQSKLLLRQVQLKIFCI
jgi:hypothetical protein